jgi:hypothetical protein
MNRLTVTGLGTHAVTRIEDGHEVLRMLLSIRQSNDGETGDIEVRTHDGSLISRFRNVEGGKVLFVIGELGWDRDDHGIFINAGLIDFARKPRRASYSGLLPMPGEKLQKETTCSTNR